jgi:CheY-like chemotaxis protein
MKKILIIDDDATFHKVMNDKLTLLGCEVNHAYDGIEGLQMSFGTTRPDLILLDIRMPKLDGIDFLKKLKERKDIVPIPVLITSNLTTFDKISEGVALGIKGYIVKSNESLDTIVKKVEEVLTLQDNE